MDLQELLAAKGISPQPAPKKQRSRQIDKLQRLARLILSHFLKGHNCSLQELADAVGDTRANAVSTCLGCGVGGKGGAQLWKRDGEVIACAENAALIGKFISQEQFAELCGSCGISVSDAVETLSQLPSLANHPAAAQTANEIL